MTARHTAQLHSGRLELSVRRCTLPLEELCDFATRANPRRRFLFVSKVLGKHHPVRPSRMREIHTRLAGTLGALPGPVAIIGMAETATALGHGVYECLAREDAVYMHTTRYRLRRPVAARFDETHSHATAHTLYWPEAEAHCELLRAARSLVVVDDEVTTGNTAANLLGALRVVAPRVEELHVASILNWMSDVQRVTLRRSFPGERLQFSALLDGRFNFTPDETMTPQPAQDAAGNGGDKGGILAGNFGRFGLTAPLRFPFQDWVESRRLSSLGRVLVLGLGEFMYPPFLFAEWLESQGVDVWFQSATRSPILPGHGIRDVLEVPDSYDDGIPNFIYNCRPLDYSRIYVGSETPHSAGMQMLLQQLNATRLDFC